MPLRRLGSSDLKISAVGLGTWAIGGEGAFGWGPQEDGDSIAAIHRAVELGINWVDTAPIYGFGRSEKVVGRAVKEIDASRRPYIFTKVGLIWDDAKNVTHCLKAGSVRKEVDDSLRRLGVDALDLCQIHWPSFPPGSPAPDIEEGWTVLAELKSQGKVRHIGVSNFDVEQLKRVEPIAPITSLQPPYSMLMRGIEDEILPWCRQNGVGTIVYSPMHHGLLSGKMTRERIASLPDTDWRKTDCPAFKEPQLSKALAVVEVLKEIAGRHGRTAAEVAIAWTLRVEAVTGAIVGGRRADQVDGFARAAELELTPEEIAEIGESLPASVPLMEE